MASTVDLQNPTERSVLCFRCNRHQQRWRFDQRVAPPVRWLRGLRRSLMRVENSLACGALQMPLTYLTTLHGGVHHWRLLLTRLWDLLRRWVSDCGGLARGRAVLRSACLLRAHSRIRHHQAWFGVFRHDAPASDYDHLTR